MSDKKVIQLGKSHQGDVVLIKPWKNPGGRLLPTGTGLRVDSETVAAMKKGGYIFDASKKSEKKEK